MSRKTSDFDGYIGDLIDADIPRNELGGILMGVAGQAAKPAVEKGLKKLSERVIEIHVLSAQAQAVDEDGYRRVSWTLRVRNHTLVAFAIDRITITVGRNGGVTSGAGMGLTPPDSLAGRLLMAPAESHCDFSIHTDLGRGRNAAPVVIRLAALEGDRSHEFKLRLKRPDDLFLKVDQKA